MKNHDHNHHHLEEIETRNISTAFFLNLFFTIIEIVGGFLTNSIAVLSDAAHDLGDSVGLGLAWYFQKIAKRKEDVRFSYGYRRFTVLGAIINVVLISVSSIYITIESIRRIINPEEVKTEGVFLLAILGIVVNGAAVLRLKNGNSLNERVVALHLMEDVLGWLAVLIASIIMYFWDIPIMDPILSLMIVVYIMYNAIRNIKESMNVILQGVPSNVDFEAVVKSLEEIAWIKEIADIHIWSLDGSYNILSAHLVIKASFEFSEIQKLKQEIRQRLSVLNIHHPTLEFEIEGEVLHLH